MEKPITPTLPDPIITDDLYLAAAVVTLCAAVPELSLNGTGRVVFKFPFDPKTFQAFTNYPAGGTGPLLSYTRNLKTLRWRMYQVIDNGGGG